VSGVSLSTVASADGTTIGYRSLGAGEPVVVVGGALRTAGDYLPLAEGLAPMFEVHVVDRRGRGASGPQGGDYGIEKECEDLDAVLAATGATRVFGHSFGGLVALEAARRGRSLSHVAVYEPGVSLAGSVPTDWIPLYRELLARGDRRGAFACFVKGSGHAPTVLARMPLGYVKLVLRLAMGLGQWERIEPLLEANLAEHEEVRRLAGTAGTYGRIDARVLLLAGARSPDAGRLALESLERALPDARLRVLDGLGHDAPEVRAPRLVAEQLGAFFGSTSRSAAGRASARPRS
jgi:pimeloyl-ACP methyl ester carboxylesterase